MDRDMLNALREEMFLLNEVSGQLDPESNRQIDQRIEEILKEIKESEEYDEVGC